MAKTPSGNVHWRDVPKGACIEDRGKLYVAHMPGGRQAVVFWHGAEAKSAQAHLWARTQDAANVRCVREIRTKQSPLPGLRGPRRRRRRK